MKIVDIIAALPGYTYGNGDLSKDINCVSTLSNPRRNSLLFCKRGFEKNLAKVQDSLVILEKDSISVLDESNVYIISNNPRLTFARIIKKFFVNAAFTAKTFIHPNVVMDVSVIILGKVWIGENVTIQPYVTIGTSGFGFERNAEGVWESFPQIGGVVIEDNVEIASHTNIHRGTIDNTIIRQGSKISINCNIGHNSVIGKHTFIAGKTNLGGKTQIGDYCFIGMSVVTRPGVKIGNNTVVGMGSLVTKDIESDCIAYGAPARRMKDNPERFGG